MDATTETIAVERQLEIDASPETVWELLTDEREATRRPSSTCGRAARTASR